MKFFPYLLATILYLGIPFHYSYSQAFLDHEGLQGFWGAEERLRPVLSAPETACEGEVIIVNCDNCHPSDGLYWAVQGSADIIRKTGTFTELRLTGPGAVRIALERENFWGIGRSSKSLNSTSKPAVNLASSSSICEDDTLQIDLDNRYSSYMWADGIDSSYREITKPGLYQLKVVAPNGCKAFYKTIVRTLKPPVPDLGADRFTCSSKKPTLFPGNYSKYLWQNGSRDSALTANFEGTYWVRVTDQCGQTGSDTVAIIDRKLPKIDLGNDRMLCLGDTLALNAGEDYGSYRWNNGIRGNTLSVWASGTYQVEAADISGCVTKANVRIEVSPCLSPLGLPLVITPNRDGLNDSFQPQEDPTLNSLSMQIFSTDGLLLFASDNKNQGWNGSFNTKQMPAGKYPFTIQYRKNGGEIAYRAGRLEIK